jgi:hypothetical protein
MLSKLCSEFGVERTAVADEGTCLSYITNKALLGCLKFIGCLNPTNLVISKRVNKLIGLVHLPLCLHSFFHKSIFGSNLCIELSLKFSLKSVDLIEFSFCSG